MVLKTNLWVSQHVTGFVQDKDGWNPVVTFSVFNDTSVDSEYLVINLLNQMVFGVCRIKFPKQQMNLHTQ